MDTNPTPAGAIPAYPRPGKAGMFLMELLVDLSLWVHINIPLGPYKHSFCSRKLPPGLPSNQAPSLFDAVIQILIFWGFFGWSRAKSSETERVIKFPGSGCSWAWWESWIPGKSLLNEGLSSSWSSARNCWVAILGFPTSPLRVKLHC